VLPASASRRCCKSAPVSGYFVGYENQTAHCTHCINPSLSPTRIHTLILTCLDRDDVIVDHSSVAGRHSPEGVGAWGYMSVVMMRVCELTALQHYNNTIRYIVALHTTLLQYTLRFITRVAPLRTLREGVFALPNLTRAHIPLDRVASVTGFAVVVK
jgi:hypothetical protein